MSTSSTGSLRIRLALGLGLLAVLLTGALALVVGELATTLARKEIGRYLARLSIEMRDKLDVGMFERVAEIEMLANLDAPADAARNTAMRKRLIEELRRSAPDYSWLGYVDTEGRVGVSFNGLLQGADLSSRPWFRRGLAGPYVGDVRDATLLPHVKSELPRVVDIAFPLREGGRVYGVVAGYVSWKWVERLRDSIEAYARADAPFELLVVSADNKVLLGPAALAGTRLQLAELIPSRLLAYDARLETWPDGIQYLTGTSSTRGYGSYRGVGWSVIARQRADLAFAPVRLLQQRIAIAGALVAVLAILVGWWIATRVSRPLAGISTAADAISRGSRRVQIPSGGGYAEVERLAISLRAMLASLTRHEEDLRQAQAQLEARVKERTAELVKARAEMELEAAELAVARDEGAAAKDRLALAMDASRLVLWDYDVAAGKVTLSEAWSELLGGKRVATTETFASLAGLVPEEDQPAVRAAIEAAVNGPASTYRVEHRVRTAGGTPLWIVSEGRVVERDAAGRALRMIGTNRDITDRVRDAEALRAIAEEFRGAFEHSATGMAIIGLDGRWQMVNPALCAITGYTPEELLERTFTDITHPEDRSLSPAQLQELLDGRRDTYQIEKRYVHKQGHAVWVQANVSLVRNAEGKPLHLISQIIDVSERRRLQAEVEHLALHDQLTGLPNSRLLLDRLAHALATARRTKRPIGVMYLDLDGFKPINDTYGHAAGDLVLKEFSARVSRVLRANDTIARVGGDEFVAVLGEVDGEAEARLAAERVLEATAKPFDLGNAVASLSTSIGIALFPAHGEDPQSLLQRADTAMYQAKRAGKNSFRFFAGGSP
ncbi:MAG: diguanylate cyclase [Proteobacteria bacterium]|nr:diguanylate cyclase [Pseudomonadota bacterium]